MEFDIIIFWIVLFWSLIGLVTALKRIRAAGPGWAILCSLVLLVCVAGRFAHSNTLVYIAGALWLTFAMVPGLIGRLYFRRFFQQRYSAARRLARIISWLHPADGWRQQPEILRALELARRGELEAALEILRRYTVTNSPGGLAAMTHLCRLTYRWEPLLAWAAQHPEQVERHSALLPSLLRAKGETGDLPGLIALYEQHKHRIRRLTPPVTRDFCRLMLFAFSGKRDLAGQLLAGHFAILPTPVREFWLATADLAAGRAKIASQELQRLLPEAEPTLRLALQHRLGQVKLPPVILDPSVLSVIDAAAVEHRQENKFAAQPSLFAAQSRATQILIALNLVMFAAEIYFGGATNEDTLLRLGALFPPVVREGEWWRLGASLFLHFGIAHLSLNMLALWVLGPFVEFALGHLRFVVVYLAAGLGSMGVVIALATGARAEQVVVGASGSIMGLVGATGGLMLRAWFRERAPAAQRRLISIFAIVALQTVFDALVPQVSMTAHLSGALIGFTVIFALRDRW